MANRLPPLDGAPNDGQVVPPEVQIVLRERAGLALRDGRAERVAEDVRGWRSIGGEIDRVRLMWTEGRVAAGLGRVDEGIGALVKVRGEFASRQMHYDTVLVSLELAVLYAKEGKTSEVKTLARHMVPIFQSQDVHREALAALTLFRQAAEAEKVTEEFAREVLLYLLKARSNPEMKFVSDLAASH